MTLLEENIVALQHDKLLLQSKLNKANAEFYKAETDLQRALNEVVVLKAELEQTRAACAAKHDALQTIWDDDEMGWILDPESECGTEECVKCGAVLATASKEHAEGCLQGVVHKALSNTCGTSLLAELEQAKADSKRLDWLTATEVAIGWPQPPQDSLFWVFTNDPSCDGFSGADLRAAIDEAMKGEK